MKHTQLLVTCFLSATTTAALAQTSTASLAGTSDVGDFVFPAIVPGVYSLKTAAKGFRPVERKNVNVTASARLALGTIQLETVTVTESIVVQAQGATVPTGNAENGQVLDSKQLSMVSIRGRDPVSMLRILPGVTQGFDNEFAGGFFGTRMPNFQGLVTNTTTEYGRAGGAMVNIITKGGGREFHGSGYWYKRQEMFNANAFFRNRDSVAKQIDRVETLGGTIGGPVKVPIPIINRGGDKLFFFYSYDNTRIREPVALERWTMPTLLERRGDFSRSNDLNGRLIPIRDPSIGAPYPNNVKSPPARAIATASR
jgi:hypothetical protein